MGFIYKWRFSGFLFLLQEKNNIPEINSFYSWSQQLKKRKIDIIRDQVDKEFRWLPLVGFWRLVGLRSRN